LVISDIGMAGPEGVDDITVIFGALVGVFDHQLDRGTRRLAFEYAREDFDRIGLLPLRCVLVQAGAAFIEPLLDHRRFERDTRWATIDGRAKFRRELHRFPEVSGEEQQTAARIVAALQALHPTDVMTSLGGHGVAAVFDSGAPGETVLFRCELDALPIQEVGDLPWKSQIAGKGHLCGHDGHMTMVLALGRLLARTPVAKGRVVLMFQPAEEDGSGARAVVADPKFDAIKPDWAFAIHNEPGRHDAEATMVAQRAMDTLGVPHGTDGLPMRASEDFGVFDWGAKAAMLCLGPGEDYAALHNPDYDFPDDLIPIGATIFERIARDLLG